MLGRDNESTADWRVANQAKVYSHKGHLLLLLKINDALLTQHFSQINYATIIVEKFTYSCIKLSVLFFYRRIFVRNRSFRIVNNILIVLVALWGLVFLSLQAILEDDDGHRVRPWASQEWLLLWFAITDVLSDIAVLALPYPCICKLQMSRRFKVELTFVFLLGTL